MKKFLNWLKNNWLLALVVVIGGLLRFYRLEDMATFGGDQGVDYQNVAKMIVEKRLSLLGPVTHVGIFLGPLYYYLLIPFFLILKFDPVAAPVMFALFGTATVGLVYILARTVLRSDLSVRQDRTFSEGQTFSDTFAFLTALLYAVSPVILESSRAPSQPHLIPFFATLLLISLIRIIKKNSKWWDWFLAGACLASVIQFHFLAFPVWIFTAVILIFSKGLALPGKARPYMILFLIVPVVILLSPWFLFELRHNFFITNQIISYLRSGEVSFSPGSYFERVLDLIWFSFDRLIGQGNQAVTAGAIILSVSGITNMILSGIDRKVRPWLRSRSDLLIPTSIIVIYFFINILGIALYSFPLSNHYISALYPVIILFLSIGVFQILPGFLASTTLIIFIIFIFSHNNLNSNHGYTMPEWVNTGLIKQVAGIIASDINKQSGTYNIANTLDGDTRANPYRYVLTYKNKTSPLGVERYSEADHLYIISGNSINELLDDKRWELQSFPVGSIEELGIVGGDIKMYRWDNGTADRKDLKR